MIKNFKDGVSQSKYAEVTKQYRKLALIGSKEARSRIGNSRYRGKPTPMAQALLDGKTLFAYDSREFSGKRKRAYGRTFNALYITALRHGKIFRCVGYDGFDLTEEAYRGYILWMDDAEESEKLLASANRALASFVREDDNKSA